MGIDACDNHRVRDTDQHGLRYPHLDSGNIGVAQEQDDQRNHRSQGIKDVDLGDAARGIGLDVAQIARTLMVTQEHFDNRNHQSADKRKDGVGEGIFNDEFHRFNAGHTGNHDRVSAAGVEVGAVGASQNSGTGAGRRDARADHQRNQSGADGGSAACCRRNGRIDDGRQERAARNQK